MFGPSARRTVEVIVALTLVLAGCGGEPAPNAGTAQQRGPAVTVADIEADLAPQLKEQYGEAQLLCGMTDPFAGGAVQTVLQEGNGFPCMYFNGPESAGLVWVDLLVLMTGDDTYGAHATLEVVATEQEIQERMKAEGDEFSGLRESTRYPEWMYRDGLSCADLVRPVTNETAPGPDFEGLSERDGMTDGLSYPEVLYYFLDNDRPVDLDPDGDGRPCTEHFAQDEITAFYDSVRQLTGSGTSWQPTSPTVTTFDIRASMAAEELPPRATQIDCSLAGPVNVGSTFTCAPRLNQMAESLVVIVLEPDGSYLAVGPRLDDEAMSVPPSVYREGLSCADLIEPVTADTLGDIGQTLEEALEGFPDLTKRGLDYQGAVQYFYLHGQPIDLGKR
jgi:hypothetical protein